MISSPYSWAEDGGAFFDDVSRSLMSADALLDFAKATWLVLTHAKLAILRLKPRSTISSLRDDLVNIFRWPSISEP